MPARSAAQIAARELELLLASCATTGFGAAAPAARPVAAHRLSSPP